MNFTVSRCPVMRHHSYKRIGRSMLQWIYRSGQRQRLPLRTRWFSDAKTTSITQINLQKDKEFKEKRKEKSTSVQLNELYKNHRYDSIVTMVKDIEDKSQGSSLFSDFSISNLVVDSFLLANKKDDLIDAIHSVAVRGLSLPSTLGDKFMQLASEDSRNWRKSVTVLQHLMKLNAVSAKSFEGAILQCTNQGKWRTATEMMMKMRESSFSWTPTLLKASVDACLQEDDPQATLLAYKYFRRLQSSQRTSNQYKVILANLVRNDMYDKAGIIWDELSMDIALSNIVTENSEATVAKTGEDKETAAQSHTTATTASSVDGEAPQASKIVLNDSMYALYMRILLNAGKLDQAVGLFESLMHRKLIFKLCFSEIHPALILAKRHSEAAAIEKFMSRRQKRLYVSPIPLALQKAKEGKMSEILEYVNFLFTTNDKFWFPWERVIHALLSEGFGVEATQLFENFLDIQKKYNQDPVKSIPNLSTLSFYLISKLVSLDKSNELLRFYRKVNPDRSNLGEGTQSMLLYFMRSGDSKIAIEEFAQHFNTYDATMQLLDNNNSFLRRFLKLGISRGHSEQVSKTLDHLWSTIKDRSKTNDTVKKQMSDLYIKLVHDCTNGRPDSFMKDSSLSQESRSEDFDTDLYNSGVDDSLEDEELQHVKPVNMITMLLSNAQNNGMRLTWDLVKAAMSAYTTLGQSAQCMRLFYQRKMSLEYVSGDEDAFSYAIKSCRSLPEDKAVDFAVEIVTELLRECTKPTSRVFGDAAEVLKSTNHGDIAKSLYQLTRDRGIDCDRRTYRAFFKAVPQDFQDQIMRDATKAGVDIMTAENIRSYNKSSRMSPLDIPFASFDVRHSKEPKEAMSRLLDEESYLQMKSALVNENMLLNDKKAKKSVPKKKSSVTDQSTNASDTSMSLETSDVNSVKSEAGSTKISKSKTSTKAKKSASKEAVTTPLDDNASSESANETTSKPLKRAKSTAKKAAAAAAAATTTAAVAAAPTAPTAVMSAASDSSATAQVVDVEAPLPLSPEMSSQVVTKTHKKPSRKPKAKAAVTDSIATSTESGTQMTETSESTETAVLTNVLSGDREVKKKSGSKKKATTKATKTSVDTSVVENM